MADKTERTAIWKGLNRMPYIGDGEMRDMKNLSSDAFPYLSTRKGRQPYTFTHRIPGVPGDGYVADVTKLPEPSEAEQGNVYKITTDASAAEYVSGSFYYWDGSTWVKDVADSGLLGVTEVVADGCLVDSSYGRYEVTAGRYPTYKGASITIGGGNEYTYAKYWAKYLGETTEDYICGHTYAYTMHVRAYWTEGMWSNGEYEGKIEKLPEAMASLAAGRKYYIYTGETTEEFTNNKQYKCVVDSYCAWEECEEQYDCVYAMPDNPMNNQQVRFIENIEGAPNLHGQYRCSPESDSEGNVFFFYERIESVDELPGVGYLPRACEEISGDCYLYAGPNSAGQFAECYYNGESYDWRIVEHPTTPRAVTLKEYMENYEGSGLKEVAEIGVFEGGLAALIIDGVGEYKLFYNKQLWPVNNISDEAGKKLVTVGNRLVVGESGCYLHLKTEKDESGTITGRNFVFTEAGGAFSTSVRAVDFAWGNGKEKIKQWRAFAYDDGRAYFTLYTDAFKGAELKKIYNGLKVPGTDFSVRSARAGAAHTQYLEVKSATFEENKLIGGWSTGTNQHEDRADVLTIEASGAWEEFDWYSAAGDTLTFASTDPHFYDVVAWKKRLWGYQGNVMYGTAADIFDNLGAVDWNRGDNTNMEAIAQPLWQGGNITGLAALVGGLVYFKEDCITVVQGNYPAIMSSHTVPCRGLPPENRSSVAVANEYVYYLSTDGVYRYAEGLPRRISGDVKITGTDAVGASDGNKYWLSLKEKNGEYTLYVYDINRGIWHKEDSVHATSFAVINGEMHMAVGSEIYNLSAQGEDVEWMCELWYDEGTHRKKRYKEFNIRGDVGMCELYLKADDGEWQMKKAVEGKLLLKLPPFECRELGIMLKGNGKCEIKSMDRVFEVDG